MKKILMLSLLLLAAFSMKATTRLVPSEYSSILGVLYTCNPGDTILVSPGVYYENILWPATAGIKLLATGTATNTIIDGGSLGRVITMIMNTDTVITSSTVINGFTIRNGKQVATPSNSSVNGAGLYLLYSGPVISNCVFSGNLLTGQGTTSADTYGTAVYGLYANASFSNCIFSSNKMKKAHWCLGGVVSMYHSIASFSECTFQNHNFTANNIVTGGIIYGVTSDITLDRVKIINNKVTVKFWDPSSTIAGGVIQCGNMSVTNSLIANNTIEGAPGVPVSGVVFFLDGASYSLSINNSTVASNKINNTGASIGGMTLTCQWGLASITNSILWNPSDFGFSELSGYPVPVAVSYSDVGGGSAGTGNIDLAPKFTAAKNFHLKDTSPCLNAGTNEGAPAIDLEGNSRPLPENTNVDMGCYEMNQLLRNEEISVAMNTSWNIYPNPFTSSATISFFSSANTHATLSLFDISGRNLQILLNENVEAGNHEITFTRQLLPAGIYFLQLKMNDGVKTKKVMLE